MATVSQSPTQRSANLRANLFRVFHSWANQAQVARDAGMHPVHLNKILSGESANPTIGTIEAISIALEISVETLLSRSPSDSDLRIPEKNP